MGERNRNRNKKGVRRKKEEEIWSVDPLFSSLFSFCVLLLFRNASRFIARFFLLSLKSQEKKRDSNAREKERTEKKKEKPTVRVSSIGGGKEKKESARSI